MERLYALGISCIEFIQDWFEDSEEYLEVVNELANPNHVMVYLFPAVSVLDSVFASQLLLCMAFGGWLNAVMKWWLLEDRPYWWVRETSFYSGITRPTLRQFRQTCETGPGSPSGHTTTCAMMLLLAVMWISHVINDRKWHIWWWKYIAYPLFAAALVSVMIARVYVAAHFPHQCILGALVGLFLAPALCIYVCDPYMWSYGVHAVRTVSYSVAWHVFTALVTVAIAYLTYLSLLLCGWDPYWTVKLAFRWCEQPDNIHISTTPMYALSQTTGYLLGWALAVTPAVSQYRHYTKNRSLLLSAFSAGLVFYGTQYLEDNINRKNAMWFYSMQYLLAALKPFLYLRVMPTLSMWPYPSAIVTSSKKKN